MMHPKGKKYESPYLPYHTKSSEAFLVLVYASRPSLWGSRALLSNQKCLCGHTEHHLWPLPLDTPVWNFALCCKDQFTNTLGYFPIFGLLQKVFYLGFVFLHHHRTVKLFFCCCWSSTSVEGIKQTRFICQSGKWKEREKNESNITGC